MFNYLIKLLVIFTVCVFLSNGKISDKRLCADQECSVPISEAKTILAYGRSGPGMLSFKANEKVLIYSKSAGSREDLWGAVINGNRGYVPISHVREIKTFVQKNDLKFVVNTEENNVPSVQIENTPKPDKVKELYEIHEGTKIFTNDISTPVSPESDIENTQKTEPLKKEPQAINDKQNEEITNTNIVSKVLDSISGWIDDKGSANVPDEKEVDFIAVTGEDDEDDEVDGDEYDEVEGDTEIEESGDVIIQQNEPKKEDGKTPGKLEDKAVLTEKVQINDKREEIGKELEESVEKINQTSNESGVLQKENPSQPPIENLDIKISQKENLRPPLFKLPLQEVPVKPIENVFAPPNPSQQEPASGENSDKENKVGGFENVLPASNLTDEVVVETVLSEHNSTLESADKLIQNVSDNAEGDKINFQVQESLSAQENKIGDVENILPAINLTEEVLVETVPSEHSSTLESTDKLVQNVSDNLEGDKINVQFKESLPAQEVAVESEHPENNSTVQENTNDLVQGMDMQEIKVQTVTPSEEDSSSVKNPDKLVSNEEISPSSTELPLEEVISIPNENLPPIEETVNIINDPVPDDSKRETINDPVVSLSTEQPSVDYQDSFNDLENLTVGSENVDDNVNQSFVSDLKDDNSDNLVADQENESVTQNILFNSSDDLDKSIVEDSGIVVPPVEENVAPQIENDVPNARDILWGSTVRKEILEKHENHQHTHEPLISTQTEDEFSCAANPSHSDCLIAQESFKNDNSVAEEFDFSKFNIFFLNEVIVVLIITAVTVIVFLWGYMLIDKSRKEAPLISKINNLEKVYLVMQKENEILTEKLENLESTRYELSESNSNDSIDDLKQELAEIVQIVNSKEDQILNLEKELSNSTEVGLELNRMLSEFLNSENGSTMIVANVEKLQRQLIDQQDVINTCNDSLTMKDTENHELRLELEINNTKVVDLQSELNKMALNLLKIEEDKEQMQSTYSSEAVELKNKLNEALAELKHLKLQHDNVERELELKTNEYILLRDSISTTGKGTNETVNNLVDISAMKAELLQLRKEKQILTEKLLQEVDAKNIFEEQAGLANQEVQNLKTKYDNVDREKLEAQTKLEVLSNYFKEREAQLQKDLSKQESLWIERQGEATSTIERIKYMQDELQNYKTQYESLKQEILSQEVDMKSQISVLEKRAHENWVSARQAERKLEDAKHEATQLRNRLTLRERSFNDEKGLNQQNGDTQISPILNDGINNNSLMYNTRDHLTTSPPPLSGGLPPFMPPPPGVSFMPPPLGGVPMPPPGFLPPPPSMMPGDHRPPPLGRMSSPPVNSRYSPDSRYSPFRRNSPSPTSEDDYDRSSPPPHLYRGGYNPYNRDDERRDFNRPPPKRNNTRHNKGAPYSSGSANSNESLEKLNRHNSKV